MDRLDRPFLVEGCAARLRHDAQRWEEKHQ